MPDPDSRFPTDAREEPTYEFRVDARGAIIFYEAGRPYQVGGSAEPLLFILQALGVPAECSWAPLELEKSLLADREREARLPEKRRLRAYDYFRSPEVRVSSARAKSILDKYVEIANRPYFRWQDVPLRRRLSTGYTSELQGFGKALPVRAYHSHLVHKVPGEPFEALKQFLWCADSRIVSNTMLMHFLFDYKESIGQSGFRESWARDFGVSGMPPPWPGPEDKREAE